jgi:hypothetical protein
MSIRTRIRTSPRAVVLALALALAAVPAGADEPTSIALDSVTVDASAVTISGKLTLGADALGPTTVSRDPAGDARVPGAGFDLGDSTVRFDYSANAPRLVVTQKLHDGMGENDGNPPAMGFSWPIQVDDGDGTPRWLAAGSRGTNFLPSDGWWVGMCTAGSEGWICDEPLQGSVAADAITWQMPFNAIGARAGRTLRSSGAYGGTPRSFAWPSVVITATTPMDAAPRAMPADRHAGQVTFTPNPAAFAHRTGLYSMSLPLPAQPGDYKVWVRSCFGDADDPDCVVTSRPLQL